MNQPVFPDLFSVPLQPLVPVAGTGEARACSQTGARQAVRTWSERQSVMLQLLNSGPKSRQELAAISGYPINSVCSVVGQLLEIGAIEEDAGNVEVVTWADGGMTARTRLRIKR